MSEQFIALTKDKKNEKLNSLLISFSESENIFGDLYKLLNELGDNIEELLLDNIHNIVIEVINNVSNATIGNSIVELEKIKSKLELLKKEEFEDREVEREELNSILDQL